MGDPNAPPTKGDLESLRTKVDEKLEVLRTEAGHQHDDLKETVRDSQTEMLKAFYNFAESNNKRLAQNEVNAPPAA